MLRKLIKSLLPHQSKQYIQKLILGYTAYYPSFSSNGEDMILNYLFMHKLCKREPGFYIDIGAYHPVKFSCSYFFYYNQWNGINIDARPGSMQEFNRLRPRDINLEMGVSQTNGFLTFHTYPDNDTINTFKPDALDLGYNSGIKVQVKTKPISVILDEYLPRNQVIDFMSIDVEGFELEVLKSNNWKMYRPKIIVIEYFELDFKKILDSEVVQFMNAIEYRLVFRTPIGLYFSEKEIKFGEYSNKINFSQQQ